MNVDGKPEVWALAQVIEHAHTRTIYSVSWSSSNMLATCGADDAIVVYAADAQGNFQVACKRDKAHGSDVNCVAWSPADAGLLASAGDDTFVKLWHL